ncbi:MAG: type II secretion system F family protein [Oscillospiraceae bacterium]|nr:type II secretion system F family protein [Oscillospiraceae bacterium]
MVDAYNEVDAMERIKRTCSYVEKLTPLGADKKSILNFEIGGNKLNAKAFSIMCSQFSIILNAGIPVARACHLVADKIGDRVLHRILSQVADDVEGGRSLSASFADRGGDLFPATFVETVRAGEETGSVDKSFDTMHEHFDKVMKLKKKLRGAMAYPLFVLVIAVIVVIVLMVKVVPTFTAMFEDLGGELPGITKLLIAISNFFRDYILLIIAIGSLLYFAFRIYKNTEKGKLKVAEITRELPLAGNISQLSSASQFASTMGTMLGAGLPMVRSLSITARTLSNYYVSKQVGKIAVKVEEGRSVGASLKEAGVMPDLLVDMITVGENTGEMEQTLKTISNYFDVELDGAIAAAVAKLEPAIMVGLAGIAGFVVVAIYMSMFSMYSMM